MAISLRPMSFHCSSTALDAPGAGFGAGFLSCAWTGVIKIQAAKITATSKQMLFFFIGDSSPYCYRRMLQEFAPTQKLSFPMTEWTDPAPRINRPKQKADPGRASAAHPVLDV